MRAFIAAISMSAVLTPSLVEGCSCGPVGSPCDAAGRASVVFVGHVVSIDSSMGRRTVQLAVIEPFGGLQLSQLTLSTPIGEAACGYPFRLGESYVVYASRSVEGHLSTTLCSRTRPLTKASDDVAYFRSREAIAPGTPARMSGHVLLWDVSVSQGRDMKPMPRLTVTARRDGSTFLTRANERGEFEFTGLALGTYEVVATSPRGYSSIPRTVDVHDPRGCGPTPLYVRYDSRVTGRVRDSEGNGIEGLPLELLLRADVDRPGGGRNRVQTWTGPGGTFELRLVAPGEYVLGFNSVRGRHGQLPLPRAFYPNVTDPTMASRITVSEAERVRVGDFIVPTGIPLVTITGTVVDAAKQPVRDARVRLRHFSSAYGDDMTLIGPQFVTSDDGRFVFAVVAGAKYDVHATHYVRLGTRTQDVLVGIVSVTAAEAASALTVVVKSQGY